MRQLSIALWGEGPTDRYFLPLVIQRTAQSILNNNAAAIDVEPVYPIEDVAKQSNGQDILEVAIKYPYEILIIHTDADSFTYKERKKNKFDVGHRLVRATKEKVCDTLIPLIPVRMVEAWMIADGEKLREVFAIRNKPLQDLDLPKRAVLVESVPDPKATFNNVKMVAEKERGRKFKMGKSGNPGEMELIYKDLASRITLERLQNVPAYRYFVAELTKAFIDLNLIIGKQEL